MLKFVGIAVGYYRKAVFPQSQNCFERIVPRLLKLRRCCCIGAVGCRWDTLGSTLFTRLQLCPLVDVHFSLTACAWDEFCGSSSVEFYSPWSFIVSIAFCILHLAGRVCNLLPVTIVYTAPCFFLQYVRISGIVRPPHHIP